MTEKWDFFFSRWLMYTCFFWSGVGFVSALIMLYTDLDLMIIFPIGAGHFCGTILTLLAIDEFIFKRKKVE